MITTSRIILFIVIIVLIYLLSNNKQENFYVDKYDRSRRQYNYYPRYWYYDFFRPKFSYSYPWFLGWWGYPSKYDPKFSVPFATSQNIIELNPNDNCHKKCADRFSYVTNDNQYIHKVKNCINKYCY